MRQLKEEPVLIVGLIFLAVYLLLAVFSTMRQNKPGFNALDVHMQLIQQCEGRGGKTEVSTLNNNEGRFVILTCTEEVVPRVSPRQPEKTT